MKNLHRILTVTSLLGIAGAASLAAQTTEPPPAVPALELGINLRITLTTTGDEKETGPVGARVHSADFDVTRMNTKDFVALLNEKYDLVPQAKDYTLVAVLVDTEAEDGYRFYLKNIKKNGTPAYVYLAPEIIGFTIDASAARYKEVNSGEEVVGGNGKFKHAVTLATAGFTTQGVASGGYKIADVTVEGVTAKLSVPSAMKVWTTGFYVENPETPEAKTFISETAWTFTAGKRVDLNDYPAPPAPEPEVPVVL